MIEIERWRYEELLAKEEMLGRVNLQLIETNEALLRALSERCCECDGGVILGL